MVEGSRIVWHESKSYIYISAEKAIGCRSRQRSCERIDTGNIVLKQYLFSEDMKRDAYL